MTATLKTGIVQEPSSSIANLTLSSSGGVTFGAAATTNTITSAAATALTLQSAGTTAMTIDTSQNVGIGTTSPISKLHVSAADGQPLTVNGATKAIRIITNSSYAAVQAVDNTGVTSYQPLFVSGSILQLGIGGTEYARMDSSGNVGINTTTMTGKLNVVGSTNGYALYVTDGTYSGGLIPSSSTGGLILYNGVAQPLGFWTNNTERMRIDSSGNLLVGTTSTFASSAKVQNLSAYATRNSGATAGKYWTFGGDGSNSFTVFNQGPTGVYVADGATSWSAFSDERLKTDLIPITNAVTKVTSLRAVTGRLKTDEIGKSRSFLIAQDVQKVLPEAVHVGDDEQGTLGLAYTEVIPLLVAAIQELKAEFDQYKAAHP